MTVDTGKLSDGYHTFDELYDHRITLFIALCRERKFLWDTFCEDETPNPIWRSCLHSDGTFFDGCFVLGLFEEKGKQITYHLPLSRWNETDFSRTLERAPEWDGHTSADVLERLKSL